MAGRVSQEVVEILATPTGQGRVSQEVVELLAVPPGRGRVSQEVVELLAVPPGQGRVSQVVVELLLKGVSGVGVLSRLGKVRCLNSERTYLNSLWVYLFINDITPTEASVYADFAFATAAGLGPQLIPPFGAATLNGSNQGQVDGAAAGWTTTGAGLPQTVFGYAVLDQVDNTVIFSARAPGGGFTFTAAGQSYSVTLHKLQDNF